MGGLRMGLGSAEAAVGLGGRRGPWGGRGRGSLMRRFDVLFSY